MNSCDSSFNSRLMKVLEVVVDPPGPLKVSHHLLHLALRLAVVAPMMISRGQGVREMTSIQLLMKLYLDANFQCMIQ